MATNKHAAIRYRILDKCFRNSGRRYFIEDLIKECNKVLLDIDPNSKGISRRQIFEDIAFMESEEGGSVELARLKDGKRVYYRYEDTSFSINNSPLNEVEVNELQSAMAILAQFKGMPQFEHVHEILAKLNYAIDIDREKEAVIEFESSTYLKGRKYISELTYAITSKMVLRVSYKPFESDAPYDVIIHPYYLKQYNNRWFLFGYNPETGYSNWNLALDRIEDISEVKDEFKPNTEIDWTDYFDDIIGVTKPIGATTEEIVLHFKGKTGKYVVNKPLHDNQRVPNWLEPDLLEVKLDLVINFELKRLILSYGPDVEVIRPVSLREDIIENLENARKQY